MWRSLTTSKFYNTAARALFQIIIALLQRGMKYAP
jgi:hypothetical protein